MLFGLEKINKHWFQGMKSNIAEIVREHLTALNKLKFLDLIYIPGY